MKWKANRLAGGLLKGCKERGEWAELYFMMLAVGLGMKVLRLFGQTGRYDVGVENAGQLLRVQVKSTIYKRRGEGYSLNVIGPRRKKYEPGTVDFFAILLIPIDEWYIIPYEVMGRTNFSVHFTPGSAREKYGEYREAWHLLKETGLTIQACVDPEWEEEVVQAAPVVQAETRIPRFARNDKTVFRNDKIWGVANFLGIRRLFGGAGRNRTDA
jgi:hypothetical protein